MRLIKSLLMILSFFAGLVALAMLNPVSAAPAGKGPGIQTPVSSSGHIFSGVLVLKEGDYYEVRNPQGKVQRVKITPKTIFTPDNKNFILGIKVTVSIDKNNDCISINREPGSAGDIPGPDEQALKSRKINQVPPKNLIIAGTIVLIHEDTYELREPSGKIIAIKISQQTKYTPNKKYFVIGVRAKALCDPVKNCLALDVDTSATEAGASIPPMPNAGAPLQATGLLTYLGKSELQLKLADGKTMKLKVTAKTKFSPSPAMIKLNKSMKAYYDASSNCMEIKPAPILPPVQDASGELVKLQGNTLVVRVGTSDLINLNLTNKTKNAIPKKNLKPGLKIKVYYDVLNNCLELKPAE